MMLRGRPVAEHNWESRWLAGDEEAAKELAAGMTLVDLRIFGTEALAACCESVEAPTAVLNVIQVGRNDPSRGHAAFDAVRELTLRAEAKSDDSALSLLGAAENVARVIYNSTNPDDPFDADSDEYVFSSIARFFMSVKLDMPDVLEKQLCRILATRKRPGVTAEQLQTIRLEKAAARWFAGDPEACKALAGAMTDAQLRLFAVEALAACCGVVEEIPSAVLQVLEAGRSSSPGLGRAAFEAVQELRSADEAASPNVTLRARLLRVAESAARIIYNSIAPSDAFDSSAGDWFLQTTASLYHALPKTVRPMLGLRLSRALAATKMPTACA